MSRKTEKSIKIAIVVLTIILIGLLGFILVDNFLLENNSKNQNKDSISTNKPVSSENPKPTSDENINDSKEEEIEISMELAEQLYNMIYDSMDCGGRLFSHFGSDKITPDDFTNLEKNFIVVMNLNQERETNDNTKYTKEKIIETKNRIFGNKTSFEIINDKSCHHFFLGKDGNYTVEWQCGGDTCSSPVITEISKAVKVGNKVYIDQAVIFVSSGEYGHDDENTAYYYQDYNKTRLIGKNDFIDSYDYMVNSRKIDWEQYRNQAGIYRYTFQDNNDGTYTFIQIEKIK